MDGEGTQDIGNPIELEDVVEPDNKQEIADSLDEVEDQTNVIDLMDNEPVNAEFNSSVPNSVPSHLNGNSQLITDVKDEFPLAIETLNVSDWIVIFKIIQHPLRQTRVLYKIIQPIFY